MAVECGWQRLAEIQDQILLICESAHVPTIWATHLCSRVWRSQGCLLALRSQMLHSVPGRSPYIMQAVVSLDDILCKESCHSKRTSRPSKIFKILECREIVLYQQVLDQSLSAESF